MAISSATVFHRSISDATDRKEAETRQKLIDSHLRQSGWIEGVDWRNELLLPDIPSETGTGFADYVLYDGLTPIALVEAKRTAYDPDKGRHQAQLYADSLAKKSGFRPFIFLTNGYETHFLDGLYPEREVFGVFSKADLLQIIALRRQRQPLVGALIDPNIANRPYQKMAIRAVCQTFDQLHRSALLSMATGSGKTRTVVSLVSVLLCRGWIKRVLFLADRTELVNQACDSFKDNLKSLTRAVLPGDPEAYKARIVFSTYASIYNAIDSMKDAEGRPAFTCGHFDLIILDEAHRSIYQKYGNLFSYFDALMIGLTATPKGENFADDYNTYLRFDLERNQPTFYYGLDEGVRDHYLVGYWVLDCDLKIPREGIRYKDLPPKEQERYESTFTTEDEDGNMILPPEIVPSKFNSYLINRDTIRKVLHILMDRGLRIDSGAKIGKTIIFAASHEHAKAIAKVFREEFRGAYPDGFIEVIDSRVDYHEDLLKKFKQADSLPQIAVSVDMLDTGIDVHEVLNLVFFKQVYSKVKFEQMIGRGTRTCPGLIDGEDKTCFYIFDICGNFKFFEENEHGLETENGPSIQEFIFGIKAELAFLLQNGSCQTSDLIAFRQELVADLLAKVRELNPENFDVQLVQRSYDKFSQSEAFVALNEADVSELKEKIAPIVYPYRDDISAIRFDTIMLIIEYLKIEGKGAGKYVRMVRQRAGLLYTHMMTIDAVRQHKELIYEVYATDVLERADIPMLERVRTELRDLMFYIKKRPEIKVIDFGDEIRGIDKKKGELSNPEMKDYRARANAFIESHAEMPAIKKLHLNEPLTADDIKQLEDILWEKVGTKEEYTQFFGTMTLGQMVREVVGLDEQAAREVFSRFLGEVALTKEQSTFVELVIRQVVTYGEVSFEQLNDDPFVTGNRSLSDIFRNGETWNRVKQALNDINGKAMVG